MTEAIGPSGCSECNGDCFAEHFPPFWGLHSMKSREMVSPAERERDHEG